MPTKQTTKQKLNRIMGVTGWTRKKMARLVGASERSVWLWSKGRPIGQVVHMERIDWLYAEIVEPFICDIEKRADVAEKKMLQREIKGLADNNICKP